MTAAPNVAPAPPPVADAPPAPVPMAPVDPLTFREDPMNLHDLKSWPEYFQAVVNGHKRFEVRRDDRPYKEGDIVLLREFIPSEEYARAEAGKYDLPPQDVTVGYTGRTIGPFRIGYLARGECMPEGCCAFELIKLVAGRQP